MNAVVRIVTVGLAAAAIAVFVYLRDPPWLIGMTSGLSGWRTDASGIRYRTMSGRASFFVPADAVSVSVPIRAPFESPVDWPIVATFWLDDKTVDRLTLSDDQWHTVTIRLPPSSRRRVRRIEVHANRTRSRNRGPHVGETIIRTADTNTGRSR